jgi:hypothetical protein
LDTTVAEVMATVLPPSHQQVLRDTALLASALEVHNAQPCYSLVTPAAQQDKVIKTRNAAVKRAKNGRNLWRPQLLRMDRVHWQRNCKTKEMGQTHAEDSGSNQAAWKIDIKI